MDEQLTSGFSIRYCDFIGCAFDGAPMAGDRPVIVGNPDNANVAFPKGWTSAQIREWRALMDMLPPPSPEPHK